MVNPAPGTASPAERTGTPLLAVRGLRIGYRTSDGTHIAVDGLDLTAAAGQITAVVGESGSGKSSTAHALIGLLPAGGSVLGGSVRLQGEELTGLGERAWREVRGRRVGLIPQDPGLSLDPVKPVGGQVAEVLRVHGLATRRDATARAVDLLAEAGLPDPAQRARQYPHELSGGMRQRVLIAIATAARPRLLVADEPTSALDVTVQRQILDHLQGVVTTTGTAMLLVTHDLAVVADRAQHVVVMSQARVVEAGPAEQVLTDPQHPYTRRLLADAPTITARAPRRDRTDNTEPPDAPHDSTSPEATGATAAPLLRVTGLTRAFPVRGAGLSRRRSRTAVDGVGFELDRGETLGLVGESGSGKSTTARLILGLERADSGAVLLDGADVTTVRGAARRALHRRIQFVYQNPYASLNPRFTVEELLTEPLRNHRIGAKEQWGATVRRLLADVALPAGTERRKAAELSGGQRQRVAIARALALGPELLVCDEPVSALDVTVQARILELLIDLQERHGLSYLFISHDLAVVAQVSDRIAVMRDGRIVESGPADELLRSPSHPYTKELLAAVPGDRRINSATEDTSWS
ncbi:ABC transporter ATP-binding protein (plasmid) [Streptomyces sp. NBC_01732]|uniref:dipeptide ABC transporter ATP-binding protein n=1 Tax=unclassified Streptomyces TaxID=2593676 RepID=UPI001F149B20|nr:ABC transporter ATP-binding protein [Streptomyces sp. ADI95-17]WSG56485.1 ABC transporter ATP-binding protein [Streptomyces sp. NBC_01732]WSX07650.1 ABC transporter ATP-binding protein [Streptomyces sp. NBC_00987]